MGIFLDWSNLGQVALPFLISFTAGAILAFGLQRVSAASGLREAKERTKERVAETDLPESGSDAERNSTNLTRRVSLVLFEATATIAILTAFWPDTLLTYVLPFGIGTTGFPEVLRYFVLVTSAGSAVIVAAYFLQDLPSMREWFIGGAATATALGLCLGTFASGVLGVIGLLVTPFTLGALLLAVALEHRAKLERPMLGLRALGATTVPLFFLALLALVRIVEIIRLAL